MTEAPMDTTKITKNDTRAVSLRLPTELVDDCEEHAKDGEQWTDQLRKMIGHWREAGAKCDVPKNAEDTKMVMLSLPVEDLVALEREAERLTKRTGKAWSVARVVRLIWAKRRRRIFS